MNLESTDRPLTCSKVRESSAQSSLDWHPNNTATMCLHPTRDNFNRKKATLILEDGSEFPGFSFGAETSIGGEIGREFSVNVLYAYELFSS